MGELMVQILTQGIWFYLSILQVHILFTSVLLLLRIYPTDILTHTGAEWYMHKASHCFVVSKAKVENNLSVYQ